MIHLINFPFCNASSILRFLNHSNKDFSFLSASAQLKLSDTVLLPGVGTFEQGMRFLTDNNLVSCLQHHANDGGKIVGICLGMQLLLHSSEESPGTNGLSIIPGHCKRLVPSVDFRVPHIGWNEVVLNNPSSLHNGLQDSFDRFNKSDFYFVHSFVAHLDRAEHCLAYFSHPTASQVASICSENVLGFQFHPEKSGPAGYSLLSAVLG